MQPTVRKIWKYINYKANYLTYEILMEYFS
jgi:hypothetical protein